MRRREPSTLPTPTSTPGRAGDREFSGTERFQLIRQLGMGGMGIVFEALDHETGETVALKTLRNVNGNGILLLKQEFRTLAGLHHPNLIRLGELFESRGDWFFTMELIEGVSLMEWLRAGDQQRMRDALAQMVTGLGVLHDAGRIHRDIKPSNVMVTGERVVLVDFGLAIRHDGDPLSWSDGDMAGTPAYMAPEQASARPTGPEADFYAVGVILYEALTKRLPISGHALQVMLDKQHVVPPAPSTIVDVPADLDTLCCELLQIDPAARPVRSDILRLLAATPRKSSQPIPREAPMLTPSPRQMFVGREAELAALKDALAECDKGGAVNLLIEGESGLGKSALAEHFLARLDRRDVVVLRGRCYERESVPYKGIDGVIDSLSRWMARLPDKAAAALLPFHINLLAEVFPVLRGVRVIVEQPPVAHVPDPQEERRRVFAAVRELIARIGARHPLVILIDDLHWADEDSLALLDTVLRGPDAPCVLLISTAWPRGDDEAPIEFGGDLRKITLRPLGEGEAAQLAHTLFMASGMTGSEATSTIVRESAGHPMFVAELVRHAVLHGDAASLSDEVRLDDVLAARIDTLDPAERELLELVATAGQPLPLDVAGRALGVTPGKLVPLVGYLQTATLLRTVRTQRDSVETYHDRTRLAVVARTAERKPGLHRRLAIALEATDAETQPLLVGVHWEQAGEPGRAAALYARAGDRATEAFAFERAVKMYERCLLLAPEMSSQIRRKLGDAYANAGRGREAADVYLALAGESRIAADALELEQKAAHEMLRAGLIDEGMEVLDRLLASVGIAMPTTPRRALASLLWRRARLKVRGIRYKERDPSQIPREELARMDIVWSAACGLSMTDWIHGAAYQALNLLLALDAGESLRVRRALFLEACHTAASGNAERASQLIAAATAGKELEDPYLRGWLELARGYSAYFRGAWRAAVEGSERADEFFGGNCANVVWERDTAHAMGSWALVYLGSVKKLSAQLPQRLLEAELQGNLYALSTVWAANSTIYWIARDDVAAGRAAIAPIQKRWSLRGYQLQHWNQMHAQAQFELYTGDVLSARRRVDEGWVQMSRSLLTRIQIVRFEVNELQVRTAIAAARATRGSERRELLETAERHLETVAREPLPWMKALTTVRRACLRAVRGDTDGAVREFRAAVAACDAADLGLYSTASRLRLGELLGGDEGRALREEALAKLAAEEIRNPERFVALFAP